jgi:hypothetical protein
MRLERYLRFYLTPKDLGTKAAGTESILISRAPGICLMAAMLLRALRI